MLYSYLSLLTQVSIWILGSATGLYILQMYNNFIKYNPSYLYFNTLRTTFLLCHAPYLFFLLIFTPLNSRGHGAQVYKERVYFMKRSFILILIAMFVALPAMASLPSSSYDEELYGRAKSHSTVKLHIEVNAGFIAGGKLATRNYGKLQTNLSRPYVDVIAGMRLGEFLFAGVGVGAQYAYAECKLIELAHEITDVPTPQTWGMVSIPIYANVKGYIPTRVIVKPYISVSLGGHVVATSNFSKEGCGKIKGGLMMKFGAGLKISKFNFGIGMASQNIEWVNPDGVTLFKAGNNAGYIEVGVAF